jgi:probable dihydroxyacetone kinase regulator
MANCLQIEQDIIFSFKQLMRDHDFDGISIADIAAGAKITRRAFYNHYKDKYELVNKIFDQELFPFVLNVTNINDWYKGSIYICDYLKKNQSYYKKILPLKRQNCLQEEFHKLTEMQMELLIPEALHGREISGEDRLFLTEYYYNAYMGLVSKWIMGAYKFSCEEFVMRWRSMLENSLHNFLRDFAK